MKKSTIAVVSAALLGGIWTGGAWYTGKKAEAEYIRQINYANQQMAAADTDELSIKIDNVKFERGLFSSDFSYDIAVKTLKNEATTQVLPFEGKFYHGPLPLDRLAKFNLSPVVFSATIQTVKNDDTKAWFDATNGKNPTNGTMVMSYAQRLIGDFNIAGGKTHYQGIDVAWSDTGILFDTDLNGGGSYQYELNHLKAFFNEQSLGEFALFEETDVLKTMEITLSDLKGEYDFHPTDLQKIFIGRHNIKVGDMTYAYTYKDSEKIPPITLAIKNTLLDYGADRQGEFLNYMLKNKAENILLNQHPLGELQLDLQINHLSTKVMSKLAMTDPNDAQAVQAAGLELLQNQPHLQIAPLKLTTPNGKIEGGLNVELADMDFAQALQGKFLSLFKQLDIRFEADKSALQGIISLFGQLGGMPQQEADKFAQEQVEVLSQEGEQQELIINTDKNVSATLLLEGGELKFNGNVIPEEHIGMFLMGLMMH